MSNSLILDGKVLDWKFKKLSGGIYAFYTGEILQGKIYKMKNSWSAVPNDSVPIHRRISVKGFRKRDDAAEYLLNLKYYFPEQLKEWEDLEYNFMIARGIIKEPNSNK